MKSWEWRPLLNGGSEEHVRMVRQRKRRLSDDRAMEETGAAAER